MKIRPIIVTHFIIILATINLTKGVLQFLIFMTPPPIIVSMDRALRG